MVLKHLEALSVDDGRTRLIVFLLGDPHGGEGGEGGKDGTTDPDGVLALRGGDDLDLHGRGGKGDDFLVHTFTDSGEHGCSSGKNDVGIQVLTDINITLHDGVEGGLVDTSSLKTNEGGLEEGLRASESLISNGDDLTIGKFIVLLDFRGGLSLGHLLSEVKGNVGKLLLDITNDFTLSGGGEGITTFSQDLHHVVSQITTSKIQTKDGMGKRVTLIDGDSVGDTITRVKDDTGGTTRGI